MKVRLGETDHGFVRNSNEGDLLLLLFTVNINVAVVDVVPRFLCKWRVGGDLILSVVHFFWVSEITTERDETKFAPDFLANSSKFIFEDGVVMVLVVVLIVALMMMIIVMIVIVRNLENIDEELLDVLARSQAERTDPAEIRDGAVQDFSDDALSAAHFGDNNVAEDGATRVMVVLDGGAANDDDIRRGRCVGVIISSTSSSSIIIFAVDRDHDEGVGDVLFFLIRFCS